MYLQGYILKIFGYTFLSLFLFAASTQIYAADCETGSEGERIQCLQNLVGRLKDGMRKLIGKSEQDLKAAKSLAQENKKLIDEFKKNIATKDKLIDLQKKQIADYEEDKGLSSKQIKKLKMCCLGNPNNAFRANIGVGGTSNNSEFEPAALIGLGVDRYNVHFFLQSENYGMTLGIEF